MLKIRENGENENTYIFTNIEKNILLTELLTDRIRKSGDNVNSKSDHTSFNRSKFSVSDHLMSKLHSKFYFIHDSKNPKIARQNPKLTSKFGRSWEKSQAVGALVCQYSLSFCCFLICEIPRNSPKIRTQYQFKVIQERRSWCQSKAHNYATFY